MTVSNSRPDIATDQVIGRLTAALDLIREFAPHRWRRLRRDLSGIVVQRFPCRAAYFPDARACLIELTFLAHPQINAAQVAASIIHESIHARIHAAGVVRAEALHAREERLCREAELEFGRVVPGGEPVVARALESLSLADDDVAPTIDWGEAVRRVEAADQIATEGLGIEPANRLEGNEPESADHQ